MGTSFRRYTVCAVGSICASAALGLMANHANAWSPSSFLSRLDAAPAFSQTIVAPSGSEQGDQNPYGVAVAPVDSGLLRRGDILVSDFNNATQPDGSGNLQATGSSIVRVDPRNGSETLFFDAGAPIGLTTALVALRSGFVVVGSAQRVNTTPPTVSDGTLIFIDGNGHRVLTLTDSGLLNGVWDMTANDSDPDRPVLFVSSVLSGSVVRIVVHAHKKTVDIESITKIGSGFTFALNDAALVVGPTGLAWCPDTDELFVADTGANRIAKLDHASRIAFDQGPGETLKEGPPLFGPLGLVLTPEHHLLAVNGDAVGDPPSNQFNLAVELTTRGDVVATRQLDTTGVPGALFGIALTDFQRELSLVFVDDNDNTVKIQKTR